MTYQEYTEILKQDSQPKGLHPLLLALWWDFKNDWHKAHEIAQSKEGTLAYDRLHAYLHRKEGDKWNANYWYRRCGEQMREITLQDEWQQLVKRFLTEY